MTGPRPASVRALRTVEFRHAEAPTALIEERVRAGQWRHDPVDRLARCGTTVGKAYSQALRTGVPLAARSTWARFCMAMDVVRFDPGEVVFDDGEVHDVPAPLGLLDLPDLDRRRELLEVLHSHLLLLAAARGWDTRPLAAARQAVLDAGLGFRLESAPKSSPDRRHRSVLAMEIDGAGDAWLTVTVADRAGVEVLRSRPVPTDESVRSFNAAKRALRWRDARTVEVDPWPLGNSFSPGPPDQRVHLVRF